MEFKEKFIERYSKLTNWDEFSKICAKPPKKAIRVNTLKISIEDLKKRLSHLNLKQVPWCKEGFFVEEKISLGNQKEHALGLYYVQDPSSMIPPIVLDPKPGETVLDMCAAPGSKSTQIAMYMKNEGLLICNDYKGLRIKPLGLNIQRCGCSNAAITIMEGRHFGSKGITFDKILVDAPCSGTGTIRKSFKTTKIWNPNMIKRIAAQQKQLLNTALDITKSGGKVVYSLEPQEDEGVIDHILKTRDDVILNEFELPLKRGEPVLEFNGETYDPEVAKTMRIWPQDNDTEGFFIASLTKK